MAVMLGMIGTGEWSNEERPKSFREGILKLFPNGDVPLTAIMSKGRSSMVNDPEFKWYSKLLAAQGGTCAGAYEDPAMGTAYAVGDSAASGASVYAKVAEAVADHFRPGHVALLLDKDDFTKKSYGKVTSVSKNGDSSYVAVKLLASSATGYLNAVDYIDIIGNVNPEGSFTVDALAYQPTKFYNYTQIWRTALDITRTQRHTRMRIGDPYQEAKREALLYHGIEMEMSALFGTKSEGTGSNGKPERTTEGLVTFIENNSSDNIFDYTDESLTWKQGGEDWIDEKLEQLFRYGRDQKLAFCGSGALLGIQQLAKLSGHFTTTTETAAYGIQVVRWVTPFGEILLKRHPLFSYKEYLRNQMVVFEPENLMYRHITDTKFLKSPPADQGGYQSYDGTKEEYLTEAGYEFHFPETMGLMKGVGLDGTG